MNSAARVEEGLAEAARVLPSSLSAHRPYRRLAFMDSTNLLIFAVALAAGVGKGLWRFTAGVLVAEALWLALASRIGATRRGLDARFAAESAVKERQRRNELLGELSTADRARIEALIDLRQGLARRATASGADAGTSDRMLDALGQTDALFGLGVLEARRSARLKTYLRELDPEQIERDLRRLADAGDTASLELARQRQARAREGQTAFDASRERVMLLENALRAVASREPTEAPQPPIGDLLSGVDALVQAKHPLSESPGSWRSLMNATPN
ncbi:MAG: hypothetical protein ABI609_07045 [Acidobacteriota bacterium]